MKLRSPYFSKATLATLFACAAVAPAQYIVPRGGANRAGIVYSQLDGALHAPNQPVDSMHAMICPVAFQAQHKAIASPPSNVRVQPTSGGQKLQLTLPRQAGKQVKTATIAVHGWFGRAAATPTVTANGNAVRIVTANFLAHPDGSATAEIVAPQLNAVSELEVQSIVYVDGSRWTVGNGTSCRVTPELLMLVAH